MSLGGYSKIVAMFDSVGPDASGSFTSDGVTGGSGVQDIEYDPDYPVGYKARRAVVSFQSTPSFKRFLSDYHDLYSDIAGTDLSSLFFPYAAASGRDESYSVQIPVMSGLTSTSGSSIDITATNLLPFYFEPSGTPYSKYSDYTKDDSIGDLTSGDVYTTNIKDVRDPRYVRSIGFRLPMVGVGWGYDLDDNPVPAGSGNLFAGDVNHGSLVDPADYVAAPIDFRYDTERNVWTLASMRRHQHLENTHKDGGPAFASFFADDLAEASGLGYQYILESIIEISGIPL